LLGHLRDGGSMLWESRNDDEEMTVEKTSFNKAIGKQRAFASTSFQFERVRDLTKHFDVKVNDVVLEIAGSAVRRWLRDRGEAPTQPLVAMCPVSTRGDEQGLGNKVTSMSVSLCTDIADPAERLKSIHAKSKRAKERLKGSFFDITGALGESLAPGAAQLFIRAVELATDSTPLPANFVVSNVRGAPVPLYLAGARIESMMPMSMLAVGNGLNVTLISYCDRIDVGLIVDPEQIEDPWELAAYFPIALEELENAAEGILHADRECLIA
jgi:WS/DGAT/MGAT family acyltransferase